MNTEPPEHIRYIIERSMKSLAESLERGKSEQLQAYLLAMARFPSYSVRNLAMVLSQRPAATYVAGRQAWRKLGRNVKPGESGIEIVAPIRFRGRAKRHPNQSTPISWYKTALVYDIAQTEGAPLPRPAEVRGNPAEYLARLKAYVALQDIRIEYVENLGGANGCSSGDRIRLLRSLTPAMEFSVLVHELAHELIHWGSYRPRPRNVQEIEAEAVSYVVSQAVGLESGTVSSDYILMYDGTVDSLAASLDAVRDTASEIIGAIAPGPR